MGYGDLLVSSGSCQRTWAHAVPEAKTAKNRMHFDLRAPDDVAREVGRLVGLGASVAVPGEAVTVMHDPEGNEFCVE